MLEAPNPRHHRIFSLASNITLGAGLIALAVAVFARAESDLSFNTTYESIETVSTAEFTDWNQATLPDFEHRRFGDYARDDTLHFLDTTVCFAGVADREAGRELLKDTRLARVAFQDGLPTQVDVLNLDVDAENLQSQKDEEAGLCFFLPTLELSELPGETVDLGLFFVGDIEPSTLGSVSVSGVHARPLHISEKLIPLLMLIAMLLRLLAWRARARSDTPAEWSGVDALTGFLGLVVGTSVVALVFNPTASKGYTVMLTSVASVSVYLGLPWLLASMRSRSPADALGIVTPKDTIGIRTPLVLGILLAVSAGVLLQFVGPAEESSHMQELSRFPASTLALSAVGLLAPWYEELFFRGLIYGSVERNMGHVWGIIVSTGLFAILHVPQHLGFIWPLIPILTLAFVAGLMRYLSSSTTSAFALHLGYNSLLVFVALL